MPVFSLNLTVAGSFYTESILFSPHCLNEVMTQSFVSSSEGLRILEVHEHNIALIAASSFGNALFCDRTFEMKRV